MPYCADCDRFYNPNTLDGDGDCPEGHHVAQPGAAEEPMTVPWHFKLLLLALVIYLGWRFIQLADAGLDWLT